MVAIVNAPRGSRCNQQGIGRNIQPGGKAVQGVKVNLPCGAQGVQVRRVKACALLQLGKCTVLFCKQLQENKRVNAQA